VSSLAMRVLSNYGFPGNVRELENIIERCVTLEHSDQLTAKNLPHKLTESSGASAPSGDFDIPPDGIELDRALDNMERKLITRAMEITGGNRSRAARLLGISFRSLRYRLVKLGMETDDIVQ